MKELLFEIGTEEIPAGFIDPALASLASAGRAALEQMSVEFGAIRTFATPRRLTLVIDQLAEKQPDRQKEHIGPAKSAGFDADGQPTRAAIGFARSKGVAPEELRVVETPKGEYLMAVENLQGQDTEALLPGFLQTLTLGLVFPKSMRWADTALGFARPIQWILALYGGKVVEFDIENISSANTTRGHRFMTPQAFEVADSRQYLELLEEKKVVADRTKRRNMVIAEVEKAVAQHAGIAGAYPVLDDGLLDTVTNLVEQPFGICGSFDEKFLALPDEALITSMREHQKYFPVAGADGKLLPRFVAVNNTEVRDIALAASGHERVLRARLEDGLFFFNEDKKTRLADRGEKLHGIIFQHKLGTMAAKTERLKKLSGFLADLLLPEKKEDILRAAQLAKVDLLTEMVGEFPSLQGVMGREYALLDGENKDVAQAVEEHYLPVRADSILPTGIMGAIIGLADRLDTVAGCFALGERPTGNKDAFGLRRLSLGLLHIILGLELSLSLSECIATSLNSYQGVVAIPENTAADILDFVRRRFENDLVASGFAQDVVEAASTVSFDDPLDCLKRIEALRTIHKMESFTVLAGSFKRIKNIIKGNSDTRINKDILTDEAEKSLYATLQDVHARVRPLLGAGQYGQAMEQMLDMKEPVDRFFDEVMVMAEDLGLRQNRLNLLTSLAELVLQVGDISKMHREEGTKG